MGASIQNIQKRLPLFLRGRKGPLHRGKKNSRGTPFALTLIPLLGPLSHYLRNYRQLNVNMGCN